MHTVKFLTLLVEHHETIAYLLILLGMIFEGEIVLISSGILMHLGAVNIPFMISFLLFIALSKTFCSYYIGQYVHKKFNHTKFAKYIERKVNTLLPHFKEKPFWSIFISKFIYLNFYTVLFCGYSKIKLKTFLKPELLSTLIWLPGLLSLGYFFSYTALHVSHEVWRFISTLLLLVISFFVLNKLAAWLYKIFEEFHEHGENVE
ncbi:VTT domain-containing protein [Candidatus Nomurabacteria bacterium]|nr:VTT domain-containing protein [Candidatus Nomurabacteria bacterium]